MPESDRLLAEQFWIANTEVSPNAKDVIRLRKANSPVIEHMIHRQYRTNEAIHLSFLLESGVQRMSRTVFDDCKPWFVKPGKSANHFAIANAVRKTFAYHVLGRKV